MGVSLGKINYCMQKLIEKGWIKLSNFSHNANKSNYSYLLTPRGIEQKARMTILTMSRNKMYGWLIVAQKYMVPVGTNLKSTDFPSSTDDIVETERRSNNS